MRAGCPWSERPTLGVAGHSRFVSRLHRNARPRLQRTARRHAAGERSSSAAACPRGHAVNASLQARSRLSCLETVRGSNSSTRGPGSPIGVRAGGNARTHVQASRTECVTWCGQRSEHWDAIEATRSSSRAAVVDRHEAGQPSASPQGRVYGVSTDGRLLRANAGANRARLEQAAFGEAHDGVAGHYEMVQNTHVY